MSLKSFRNFLYEALLDVDAADVSKIYAPLRDPLDELTKVWNRHLERFLASYDDPATSRAIARTISRELNEVTSKYQPIINDPIKIISSASLNSENAKAAHAVNPVSIKIWLIGPEGWSNSYNPSTKSINILLPFSVADAMLNRLPFIPKQQIPNLKNEVSEVKFKSTIRHELTHWIDDSLHNLYITKSLAGLEALSKSGQRKEAQKAYKKDLLHNEIDIYLAPIEINAMVNQIAEYKRRVGAKKYDSISWSQLMVELPSLSIHNEKFGAYWRKKMFERLSREGLIGKNFQKGF